jgi:hypothetical protein
MEAENFFGRFERIARRRATGANINFLLNSQLLVATA